MKSTVKVHGLGFSTNLDCFHCSPLPKTSCCLLDSCSLPVNAVVGGVGMYSYSILFISLLHCLLVLSYSDLQYPLRFSNVYLRAILAGHLLLHFHKYLLQCALGLEDSFHPKGCTGLLNLLTEAPHIGDMECPQ